MGILEAAAVAGAGASIYGATKKQKKSKAPPLPQLSKTGQAWQGATYDLINQAMLGNTPWNADREYYQKTEDGGNQKVPWAITRQQLLDNYDQSWRDTRADMASSINRMVPEKDTVVRDYLSKVSTSDYWRGKDNLKTDIQTNSETDRQWAMGAGIDSLASEKRIAAGITDMFNRQQEQNRVTEMQYGTLQSGLSSGFGSLAGWSAAARDFGRKF